VYYYGDVIIRRGERLNGIYIIKSGTVKVLIEFVDFVYTYNID
jgi:CRP-like cAMP-binding protein